MREDADKQVASSQALFDPVDIIRRVRAGFVRCVNEHLALAAKRLPDTDVQIDVTRAPAVTEVESEKVIVRHRSRPFLRLDDADVDDVRSDELPEHRVQRQAGNESDQDRERNEASRLLRRDDLSRL